MKQLLSLFLLLLPCLAWAQYPSNGNQKITLGEQTTADGLIFRGVAATDTVRKPSIDTMAYMVLDTTTNIMWHYKKATSNAWLRLNLLPSDTASMLTNYWRSGRFSGTLPVANGGTNTTSLTANKVMVGNGTSGVLTPTNLHWDNTNSRLGIGTSSPKFLLSLFTSTDPQDSLGLTTYKSGSLAGGRQNGALKVVSKTNGAVFGVQNLDATGFSGIEYIDNLSNLSVFTGYSNSSGEYRVNNIASNAYINFLIDGNSELYVKNNGNIGLSTDNPSEALHVVGNARISGLANAANPVNVQVDVNGVLVRTSSIELKEHIESLPYGLNEILLLQPSKFNYKDKYKYGEGYDIGFIAEDVNNVIPEAVGTGVESDIFMDSVKLIPVLVKAIQEQQALIKALEQRIINLENK
jgi:hypothetical protein